MPRWLSLNSWRKWHWPSNGRHTRHLSLGIKRSLLLIVHIVGITLRWLWHRWETIGSSDGIFPMMMIRILWGQRGTINKWNRLSRERKRTRNKQKLHERVQSDVGWVWWRHLQYYRSLMLYSFDGFYRSNQNSWFLCVVDNAVEAQPFYLMLLLLNFVFSP